MKIEEVIELTRTILSDYELEELVGKFGLGISLAFAAISYSLIQDSKRKRRNEECGY